jgi:hypothetical protein
MSRRVLIALGLFCGCSAVSGPEGALGGDAFGEGTSGGPVTGANPTRDPDDDSSSGAPEVDTDDGETDGAPEPDGGSSSGGEDDDFMFVPGLYVSQSVGADSNDGSREAPMRTIQWALQEAETQGLQAVYVAAGTYSATHDNLETIELREGISLFGGFSTTDWEDRDPALYTTQILDASIATTGVSDLLPHHPLYAPLGVTEAVEVDGFTITAAGAAYASAVLVEGGSPIFANNTFQGQAAATDSTAVRINGGSPLFIDNVIDPVAGTSSSMGVRCDQGQPRFVGNDILSGETANAYGLYYNLCDGTIAHNVVQAELPLSGTTRAIELRDSGPDVLSNSISANPASGYTSYHMSMSGTSAPRVDNNNFVQVSDLGDVYCVYASSTSQPSSVSNNNFNCTYLYYGAFSATTLLELETNLDIATDNVSLDAAVMDAVSGDLRLRDDGTVPCALARGGLAVSGLVPDIDRDGSDRTDPWSIGAFELDGDCR